MTLILSEKDAEELLDMEEVVSAVEEAFRRQGMGEASNYMRTRSRASGSVLNVMHATLTYLGRGGLKSYMSSKSGVKFVIVLFDTSDSTPLAVMGADMLGRYRTGAASAVATKHLYHAGSTILALCGAGRQALTQVLAIQAVSHIDEVRVWSPSKTHREKLVHLLEERDLRALACGTPEDAVRGAEVVSSITSSREPFLTGKILASAAHVNIAGSNDPERAEATLDAIRSFDTVVVDDIPQARVEYGDLIQAFIAGVFRWEDAIQLSDVVSGKVKPRGRSIFKSGGAALEDIAVASLLYDKATKSGTSYTRVDLS